MFDGKVIDARYFVVTENWIFGYLTNGKQWRLPALYMFSGTDSMSLILGLELYLNMPYASILDFRPISVDLQRSLDPVVM
jgi:hypothetical protein